MITNQRTLLEDELFNKYFVTVAGVHVGATETLSYLSYRRGHFTDIRLPVHRISPLRTVKINLITLGDPCNCRCYNLFYKTRVGAVSGPVFFIYSV